MFYLAIPQNIFELLKSGAVVKYMKACSEINIAFVPYEEQVKFINYFMVK